MSSDDATDAVDPLKALWTREEPPRRIDVEDLREEVRRRRRRMLVTVAGELVLTLALVALTVVLLGADGPARPRDVTWLGLLWLTWLIAAGFATWNRWGVWTPSAETARSYLELSVERARRRRRVGTFVLALASILLALLLFLGEVHLLGLALMAAYVAWAAWYRRRADRDLEAVREIDAEFRSGDRDV